MGGREELRVGGEVDRIGGVEGLGGGILKMKEREKETRRDVQLDSLVQSLSEAKKGDDTHSTNRKTFPSTLVSLSFGGGNPAISGQTFSPNTISRFMSVSSEP